MCNIKNIVYFYMCKLLIPKISLITRINYNPCVQAVHAVALVHFRCLWGLCTHNQISTLVCVITNTYTIIVQHMYLLNKAAYAVQKIVTRFLHFINYNIAEYSQRDIFTIFTNWIQFVNNYPLKTLSGLHKCKDQVHSRTFSS